MDRSLNHCGAFLGLGTFGRPRALRMRGTAAASREGSLPPPSSPALTPGVLGGAPLPCAGAGCEMVSAAASAPAAAASAPLKLALRAGDRGLPSPGLPSPTPTWLAAREGVRGGGKLLPAPRPSPTTGLGLA